VPLDCDVHAARSMTDKRETHGRSDCRDMRFDTGTSYTQVSEDVKDVAASPSLRSADLAAT